MPALVEQNRVVVFRRGGSQGRLQGAGVGHGLPTLGFGEENGGAMLHRSEKTLTAWSIEQRGNGRVGGRRGEEVVAGGHLGQMHVGFDADPLEGLQFFGLERVVEILGHGVGIGGQPLAVDPGGGDRRPFHHPPDSVHQLLGRGAAQHLVAHLFLLVGRQHVVEPGQQGSNRQSHGKFLGGAYLYMGRRKRKSVARNPRARENRDFADPNRPTCV